MMIGKAGGGGDRDGFEICSLSHVDYVWGMHVCRAASVREIVKQNNNRETSH